MLPTAPKFVAETSERFFISAAVNVRNHLDKRETRRYYVSVSQQNIGYKSAKRRDSLGAWFFVVLLSSHKAIITALFAVVNAIT